jgi:heme oxygenase
MADTLMTTFDPDGLADRFKQRTKRLHRLAEHSGVTAQILKGTVSRPAYALFLRALLPIYETLEHELTRRSDMAAIHLITHPAICRSTALKQDLDVILGPVWRGLDMPDLSARYVARIHQAAEGDGGGLIAHAYVRYLGDLNGGQVLARLLSQSLGLGPAALTFYQFPGIADLPEFRQSYRAAIDQAGRLLDDQTHVIEEAAVAFQLNIDLSQAILAG